MSVQCERKHITQLSSEQIAKEIQLIYKNNTLIFGKRHSAGLSVLSNII